MKEELSPWEICGRWSSTRQQLFVGQASVLDAQPTTRCGCDFWVAGLRWCRWMVLDLLRGNGGFCVLWVSWCNRLMSPQRLCGAQLKEGGLVIMGCGLNGGACMCI